MFPVRPAPALHVDAPMLKSTAAIALVSCLCAPPRESAVLDADAAWGDPGHCAVRLRFGDGAPLRGVVVLNTGIDGDNRAVVAVDAGIQHDHTAERRAIAEAQADGAVARVAPGGIRVQHRRLARRSAEA